MKRSTFIAIAVIAVLTVVIVLVKVIYPGSSREKTRTVLAGKEWLNIEYGLDRMELKKKTTLIVFWNYTDINSKKTIKQVEEWQEKYGALLHVAAVHSPEFAFEKDIKNIKRSVEEMKIKFPVLLDNNAEQKSSFNNESVPSLHLVNKEGKIVYSHNGDGDYEASENAIREALLKANAGLNLPEIVKAPITGLCFAITPDLYLGLTKGVIANKEGLVPDKAHHYKAVKDIPEDSIALTGKFKTAKEYLESDGKEAVIALNFTGLEVNLVAEAVNDEATLEILLNGKPIKKEAKGKNLDDKNQLKIKNPGLYQVIKNKTKPEKGILTIKGLKGEYKLYALRFYGCRE